MEEHIGEPASQSAGPDEGLLREIRQGSRDLWRSARSRAGKWSVVCLAISQAIVWCALRLLRGEVPDLMSWGVLVWAAWSLLCLTALGVGVILSLIDSLQALVADGPLLARLGQALRPPDPTLLGATPQGQFAAFRSPQALSRAARLPDLPLIVFLVRIVFGVDAKRLLKLAQDGADREAVLGELVRMAQVRAAASLHRARFLVWAILGLLSALTALLVWFLR